MTVQDLYLILNRLIDNGMDSFKISLQDREGFFYNASGVDLGEDKFYIY